jgi:hypothetical protein
VMWWWCWAADLWAYWQYWRHGSEAQHRQVYAGGPVCKDGRMAGRVWVVQAMLGLLPRNLMARTSRMYRSISTQHILHCDKPLACSCSSTSMFSMR